MTCNENFLAIKTKLVIIGKNSCLGGCMPSILKNLFFFYRDGFRSMVLGRTLWTIIFIKLVALYFLSQIFFQDYLQTNFKTDAERSDHVISHLTRSSPSTN